MNTNMSTKEKQYGVWIPVSEPPEDVNEVVWLGGGVLSPYKAAFLSKHQARTHWLREFVYILPPLPSPPDPFEDWMKEIVSGVSLDKVTMEGDLKGLYKDPIARAAHAAWNAAREGKV